MRAVRGASKLQAFSCLLERLREASDLYNKNARRGSVYSVNALVEFLVTFEEIQKENLAVPLATLSSALLDYEEGIRHPLFNKKFKRGRRPKTTSRKTLLGYVAVSREFLVKAGYKNEEAEKKIAERLNNIGVKNLGFGGEKAYISQSTVSAWCDEVYNSPRSDMAFKIYNDLKISRHINPDKPKNILRKKFSIN